jgi:molybdopterin synthase catalytic subunit
MKEKIDIKISDKPLSVEACRNFVSDESCGGISIFVGTVRNSTSGKEVIRLDFSAYWPMALKEMQKIAEECIRSKGIYKIAIHHATGDLAIGDVPVVIAASAPHRGESFSACQYAIDRLKETVPIWKKEYFHDGEVWVNAHP